MIKKIIRVLLLTIIFLIAITNQYTSEATNWKTIFDKGNNFLEIGAGQSTTSDVSDGDVKAIVDEIYAILFSLGVVVTVIIGGALGIKFMMSSAEDKAKVKESMVPYVIGCTVIYSAFGIWKICIELFSSIS